MHLPLDVNGWRLGIARLVEMNIPSVVIGPFGMTAFSEVHHAPQQTNTRCRHTQTAMDDEKNPR